MLAKYFGHVRQELQAGWLLNITGQRLLSLSNIYVGIWPTLDQLSFLAASPSLHHFLGTHGGGDEEGVKNWWAGGWVEPRIISTSTFVGTEEHTNVSI